MNDSLNNKELVAGSHQFAKAMSSDSPIIDMAKIVSRLAERLDYTTAALREMTKQRDALAAENTGMKAKGRELLGEACAVYAKFNKLIDPEIGDFIDGQTLHEFQYVLDCETPATDAFLAEVRAQGVEMLTKEMHADISGDDAREFADNLRKGVQS